MKKCVFCESKIEDKETKCPYCKAEQTKQYINNKTSFSYDENNKTSIEENISQITKDLHFIRNFIIATIIISIIGYIFFLCKFNAIF